MTRIYYVHDGRAERLIRSTHPKSAVAHAAKTMVVRVATQDDLETLLPAGIKVETDAPEPPKEEVKKEEVIGDVSACRTIRIAAADVEIAPKDSAYPTFGP